jgi:hypothetical protein
MPEKELSSHETPAVAGDCHAVRNLSAGKCSFVRNLFRIARITMLLSSSGYLVLAAVLAVSGAIKLRHPRVFAGQVENYAILPRPLAGPAAIALALAEAGGAVLLAVPGTRLAGLILATTLTGSFLAAMALALARGQRIPCACFGGTGELAMVGLPSLLRTALLGVIAVVSLAARGAAPPSAGLAEQVLAAALMLMLVFLIAEAARLLPGQLARPAGVAQGERA